MTTNTDAAMNRRLLRAFLLRKIEEQQKVIDTAPVFGKRYSDAVDELEEVEELLGVTAL